MELKVKDITKNFGDNEVLKGISFSARAGEAFGLLGRNGAGKTTTMRIILGIFKSDSGIIEVDGMPFDDKNISTGYMPEEKGLYPKVKIADQLIYFAMLKGMNRSLAKTAVEKWLAKLDMSRYYGTKLMNLSKGNQQKIQLAAALLHEPDLIILDEPFSGLDPVNASVLENIIKELISEGRTVIFSSHQMNYIESFCNEIAILKGGKIVVDGGIPEIKRSYPRDRIVLSAGDKKAVSDHIISSMGDLTVSAPLIKDGQMQIKLKDKDMKNEFFRRIAISDVDIDGIYVKEPSLTDIFVDHTEDKEGRVNQ